MFTRWTNLGALWDAAQRAARGKRRRASVARVLFDLESTLLELQRALRAGDWRPGTARVQVVADVKRRLIHVAPFQDRIVHQALCGAIGPLLDSHLIGDSYACRTGLGTHAALRRATRWARHYRWFVHLDVQKLFPTIDHALLLGQLERHIHCPHTLQVCRHIVAAGAQAGGVRFHFPGDDLLSPWSHAAGIPIGNLTSQFFANRYLSPIDHRAKDRLGIRPYLRYMDDMLVFGDDRREVNNWAAELQRAAERLRLRLHPWQVHPTRAGVSFLGYRILPDAIRVRASSVRRARGKLALRAAAGDPGAFGRTLQSIFAHWAHANSYRLRGKVLRELGLLQDDDAASAVLGAKGEKIKE